ANAFSSPLLNSSPSTPPITLPIISHGSLPPPHFNIFSFNNSPPSLVSIPSALWS
ncbi:hypothetical protein AYX13_07144, partial [Cryptococcus neoformans]